MTRTEFNSLQVGDVVKVIATKDCGYSHGTEIVITRLRLHSDDCISGINAVNPCDMIAYRLYNPNFYSRLDKVCI